MVFRILIQDLFTCQSSKLFFSYSYFSPNIFAQIGTVNRTHSVDIISQKLKIKSNLFNSLIYVTGHNKNDSAATNFR